VFVCLFVCVELINRKVVACTISEVLCVWTCVWMFCDGVRVRVCLRECVGAYTPLYKTHARCTPLHYTLYTTNINTVKGAILSRHVQDVRLYYTPYIRTKLQSIKTLCQQEFFPRKKSSIVDLYTANWAVSWLFAHRTQDKLLAKSPATFRLSCQTAVDGDTHDIYIYIYRIPLYHFILTYIHCV